MRSFSGRRPTTWSNSSAGSRFTRTTASNQRQTPEAAARSTEVVHLLADPEVPPGRHARHRELHTARRRHRRLGRSPPNQYGRLALNMRNASPRSWRTRDRRHRYGPAAGTGAEARLSRDYGGPSPRPDRATIRDFLWSDRTGLPTGSYTEDEVALKAGEVFEHVYRAYPTLPSPYYAETSYA